MNTTEWLKPSYLPILLIALMIMTRYHHFGDALHLPDASLAVFFLAGFYRKTRLFVFLLLLAGVIDYLAIQGGTSAYCISPAYIFLIPTYSVMWAAGQFVDRYNLVSGSRLFQGFAVLTLASALAFILSNGSFYLFSNRYEDLEWTLYIKQTAGYFLPYVGSVIAYVAVITAFVKLFMQLRRKEFLKNGV